MTTTSEWGGAEAPRGRWSPHRLLLWPSSLETVWALDEERLFPPFGSYATDTFLPRRRGPSCDKKGSQCVCSHPVGPPRGSVHHAAARSRGLRAAGGCRRLPMPPAALVIAHWHGQMMRLTQARHRRYLGVIGDGHAQVVAQITWRPGPPPTLDLSIAGARIMPDGNVARNRDNLGDLPARTNAELRDGPGLARSVLLRNVAPAELRALGIQEPVLSGHLLTGELLPIELVAGQGSVPCRLGSVFSRDGSGTPASLCILAAPEPYVEHDCPYVPLAVAEAAPQCPCFTGLPNLRLIKNDKPDHKPFLGGPQTTSQTVPRRGPWRVPRGSAGVRNGSGRVRAGSENEILGSDSIDDTLGEKNCPFMVTRASVFHKILPSKSGRQRSWRCVQLTNAAEKGEFGEKKSKPRQTTLPDHRPDHSETIKKRGPDRSQTGKAWTLCLL